MNSKILEELDKKVQESLENDEIPIGAVIFDKKGNIIASAANNRQKEANILGHAEINAILAAEKIIKDWRLNGYSMIVNMEPCDMCTTIIKEARIDQVFYFLNNKSVNNLVLINKKRLENEEYLKLVNKYEVIIKEYFKNKR